MTDQRGWFGRNWKWALPVGCLSLIAVPVGLGIVLVASLFGSIGSSEVSRTALEMASADPETRAALGEPIERGWMVSGSLRTGGPTGEPELAIPLRGPEGEGTLYVEARRSAGEWTYSTLIFENDRNDERLDLTPAAESGHTLR